MRKLFESVLYSRLYPWSETKLPHSQFGFRKGISPQDQALRLISFLEDQQNQKMYSVVLFTDIRKAYDRVDRRILIVKLYRMGLSGKILRSIDRIIQGSFVRVLHERHLSHGYVPTDGIPQGGVLSCLLWNLYFADLPVDSGSNFEAAFADDLALVSCASSSSEAFQKMTRTYGKIRRWAKSNRIKFNSKKVNSMLIKPKYLQRKKDKTNANADQSRKRKHELFDSVLYKTPGEDGVHEVEQVHHYRYLGVIIDDRLKLDLWVRSIAKKGRYRVDFIKR